jgi:hypothetical protein
MDGKTTRTIGLILLASALTAASSGGAQIAPQPATTLKTAPPPAPVITAWGPKDKVATGETIWLQGTNLQRDLLVVTLGDRTIMPHLYFEMLPASSSTATRIEVRTGAAMKTGVQTSTPLKVLHRGGKPVVLDADYHVVDRLARFSGASQYHKGPASSYGIYAEGAVQIDLNNLDFANEGTGTYKEQIRLIREVKKTTEPCPAPFQLMTKTTTYYDFAPVAAQRSISWKRDPAVSTRIVLYGVGPYRVANATANLMLNSGLQCEYTEYVGLYAPYKTESGCPGPPESAMTIPAVRAGGPNAQFVPVQQPPPLSPTPPSNIVYSLRRAI